MRGPKMSRAVLPTPVRVKRRKIRVDMGALRREVFERDKMCLGYMFSRRHICSDLMGSHSPYDLNRMTLGHTKLELMMGKRAADSPRECVTECYSMNVKPPSKEEREFERAYLAGLYPKEKE
jgi:hypothetical protein